MPAMPSATLSNPSPVIVRSGGINSGYAAIHNALHEQTPGWLDIAAASHWMACAAQLLQMRFHENT